MERRKVLKITAGATAAIAGVGAVGMVVLDRVFNPKTPLNYAHPAPEKNTMSLAPTPECKGRNQATLAQTEGPFYSPNTPQRHSLLEEGIVGDTLILDGFVLDTQCKPIAGAVLDFWSCDGEGTYDIEGTGLRGHQFTNANGYYRLETVRPGYYSAGPFGNRTAHIHVKVQGRETQLLTTQLYFPDEEMNAQDGIFNQRLVVNMLAAQEQTQHATFNFILI